MIELLPQSAFPSPITLIAFGWALMLIFYVGYLLLHLYMLRLEAQYRKSYGREIWDAEDSLRPRRRRIDIAIGAAIILVLYAMTLNVL